MTITLREFNPNMKPLSDEGREVLIRARARLSDPVRWTRDWLAKNLDGEPTHPEAPEAICWCVLGALRAEEKEPLYFRVGGHVADFLERMVQRGSKYIYAGNINDAPETTHEDILLWLDTALEYDAKLKEGL